jgi:hypothetical protein
MEGPEWVDKDAFVLPPLPIELNVDPVFGSLLHCMAFLELSGDEAVDPDWAVEAMEHVAWYLQHLSSSDAARLQQQLDRIVIYASEQNWPAEVIGFLTKFLENCGVVEADED